MRGNASPARIGLDSLVAIPIPPEARCVTLLEYLGTPSDATTAPHPCYLD